MNIKKEEECNYHMFDKKRYYILKTHSQQQ